MTLRTFAALSTAVCATFLLAIFSPTAAADDPPPALRVTELLYNAAGDDSRFEWVEIANLGTAVVDLSQIKLGDEETAGGKEGMARFPREATLAGGAVIVVAQSAADFRLRYGFTPDYEFSDSDEAVPDMRPFPLWAGGDFGLANAGDELLLLDGTNAIIDALSYGDSTAVFAPAIGPVFEGQSVERHPAGCDSDTAVDWIPQPAPTPGQITLEGDCRVPQDPALFDQLPPIGSIQGSGSVAALVNQIVSFRGVVTGVREDRNLAGQTYYTLFVQDVVGQEDGDPTTSDGMAVFLGRERPFAVPGDRVRVTGRVTEYFGLTEIDDDGLDIRIEQSDLALPEPVPAVPPADNAAQAAYFEALEGMRVRLPGTARVVGPTHSGCEFAAVGEDVAGNPLRRREEDPVGQIVPVLHVTDINCTDFPHLKTGDRVAGVVGPLTYHFEQFKIVQQESERLVVTAVDTLPLAPPVLPDAETITVATFNLENHFDQIDDTGDDAEPKPSAEELSRKVSKLSYALSDTLGCPTLVGVQEVENAALLHELADATAAACGFTYTVTHLESADVRGIDVALLSDPARVRVDGVRLAQTCTLLETGISDRTADCPTNEDPLFSRPPLVAELVVDERPLTVIVNHFKSKRGGAAETEPRRIAQAQHVGGLVTTHTGANPDAWVLVLGDFNDYDGSPAMQALREVGGLVDLLTAVAETERYTFVFSGAAQLIDGVFATPALAALQTSAQIQHVNANFPDMLGEDVSAAGMAHRATDHDLPLVALRLPPVEQAVASTGAAVPTAVSVPTPISDVVEAPAGPAVPAIWWMVGGVLGVTAVGLLLVLQRRRNK